MTTNRPTTAELDAERAATGVYRPEHAELYGPQIIEGRTLADTTPAELLQMVDDADAALAELAPKTWDKSQFSPLGDVLPVPYGPGSEGPVLGESLSVDAAVGLEAVSGPGDTVAVLTVWLDSRELATGNRAPRRWRVSAELTPDDCYLLADMLRGIADAAIPDR